MKKGSILIMAAAIMASVASCNKNDDTQFASESGIPVTVKFTASTSPETRIAYDGKEGKWEADDKVFVIVTDTKDTEYKSDACTINVIDDGATATLEASFTINKGTKIKKLTAYHADDKMEGVEYSSGNIAFSLPQTLDGTLSYLTTSSYTYDDGYEPEVMQGSDIELSSTTLNFKHLLARIDISTNLKNVNSITLSFEGATIPTAGKANIENGIITPDYDRNEQLITISGGKTNYQIGFIPVKFDTPTTMKATVVTDNAAYTKEVIIKEIVAATHNTLDLSSSVMKPAIAIDKEDGFEPIRTTPDGNFVLTEDLTLTEIPHLEKFSGTLDGNGHSIDISQAGETDNTYGGIFATTEGGATITNLTVNAGDRTAAIEEGGIIVGRVNSGTLTLDNVHATGNISASRQESWDKHLFVGGLVGCVPNGSKIHATDCSFKGNVTADQSLFDFTKNSYVGGIVGAVETSGDFTTGEQYIGINDSNDSYIINCKFSGTLTNTAYYASGHEIYTGGIAGRCTGLIKDCSVTDVTIEAEESSDGSGLQAKPILGNDWYEYVYNDNNSYTNVTINGESPRTGIYKGSKAAGTEKPYYSDQK